MLRFDYDLREGDANRNKAITAGTHGRHAWQGRMAKTRQGRAEGSESPRVNARALFGARTCRVKAMVVLVAAFAEPECQEQPGWPQLQAISVMPVSLAFSQYSLQ